MCKVVLQFSAQGMLLCCRSLQSGFIRPQRAAKHPGKGWRGEKGKGGGVSVELIFPALLCWNLPSFHLAMAAAMNYAWGVFEMCQEPTPTLLRCRGRLIVTLTSEVVDYKEARCPRTAFRFFFFFPSSFPAALLSVPALICNQCDVPTAPSPPPPHQVQFRSPRPFPESPLFIYPSEWLGESRRKSWLKVSRSLPLPLSLAPSLFVCVCVGVCVAVIAVWILASESPLADSSSPREKLSVVTQTKGRKKEQWSWHGGECCCCYPQASYTNVQEGTWAIQKYNQWYASFCNVFTLVYVLIFLFASIFLPKNTQIPLFL